MPVGPEESNGRAAVLCAVDGVGGKGEVGRECVRLELLLCHRRRLKRTAAPKTTPATKTTPAAAERIGYAKDDISQLRDSCVTWSHALVDVFSDSQRVLLLLQVVMLLLQGGQVQRREDVANFTTCACGSGRGSSWGFDRALPCFVR